MYSLIDQTDDFLVINKAPGISVHKDQALEGLTMLLQRELALPQLYLVHRLDKVTSGVMIFALHEEAASELSAQFRQRATEKYYLALSDRKPRRKQGAIIGDMEKSRRGGWRLNAKKTNPAITQFFSISLKPGYRLFLLKPLTGKTHQLRVALKSEGAAILGDRQYAGSDADRTYLHAYSLGFSYKEQDYRYTCLPRQGELFDAACQALIQDHYAAPELLSWPRLNK